MVRWNNLRLLCVYTKCMRRMGKWLMAFWVPAILVCGTYFFLLGANYYYGRKAALLLQDMSGLQLGPSSGRELTRLATRDGFRLDVTSDCGVESCTYWISPNKSWMNFLLSRTAFLRAGPWVGLRRWSAMGGVEVKAGQPVNKWFGVEMFEDKLYSSIAVVTSEESELRISDCVDFRLKRHPGYGFDGPANVPEFRIHVSPNASSQSRKHAFQFDLGCLKSWRWCDRFSDFVPNAWADLEDDNKWLEANRERLQDEARSDPRCGLPLMPRPSTTN